jgi:hypothetical protein
MIDVIYANAGERSETSLRRSNAKSQPADRHPASQTFAIRIGELMARQEVSCA